MGARPQPLRLATVVLLLGLSIASLPSCAYFPLKNNQLNSAGLISPNPLPYATNLFPWKVPVFGKSWTENLL